MSKRPKLLLTELDHVDSGPSHLLGSMTGSISANSLQKHGSLEAPLKKSLFAQCTSNQSRGRPNLSERLSFLRKESERDSQNYDTSQCSDDFMTPSDQPIQQRTDQQLEDQISFQRQSTLSRIDPTKRTVFDSFSTIVQELPKDMCFPAHNPFYGPTQSNGRRNCKGIQFIHGDSRLSREFDSIENIGRGSFGEVCRARLIVDGTFYAIKKLKHVLPRVSGTNALVSLLREIRCLSYLSQQAPECMNIIRYYSSWVDPSDQSIYIQTEYCSKGSLSRRYISSPGHTNCEQIQEERLVEITRQVCIGLHTIHRLGIVHLDVKPDNLLENDHGCIKISDFGLCAQICQYHGRSISEGDARYLANELLNDNYQHLDRVDMFALGASLLELCRGVPLPTQGLEYHQIRVGQVQLPERFSPKIAHLIRSLLSAEPTSRPSALEILTMLSSPSCSLPSTVRELSERLQCALKRVMVLEKELHIANERANQMFQS